ncbi:MAG TPA: class I SAM-dependent methyltransferase [Capsulimonadaceae bacterium]|nr:class I SAM-dependent methyltransferase [Capsulimonadaceae bacterium]
MAEDLQKIANTSFLLSRNLHYLRVERALIARYPYDDLSRNLTQTLSETRLTWFQTNYTIHRKMQNRLSFIRQEREGAFYGAWHGVDAADLYDAGALFLPKSSEALEMTLAMLSQVLKPGATLVLVGENDAGIKAAKKSLESRIGPVYHSDSARRCGLFCARFTQEPAQTKLDDWAARSSVEVGGKSIEIVSLPGVFSHGRLDEGTRFLLNAGVPDPTGRILDMGCGCGVIGASKLAHYPDASADMVDSDALAIEAAKRTCAANGLEEVGIWPSDLYSDIVGEYAMIISNPPFHVGKATDYLVTRLMTLEAPAHLQKGGEFRIVANRFLNYGRYFQEAFGEYRVVAENRSYIVYQAQRT